MKQYEKFEKESNLNAAILFLFSIPVRELSDKMQQAMIFYKNNHRKDWKEIGESCAKQYFKECLDLEIIEWTNLNKEIENTLKYE